MRATVIKLLVFTLLASVKEATHLPLSSRTNVRKETAKDLVKNPGINKAVFQFGNALSAFVDSSTKHRFSKRIFIGKGGVSELAYRSNLLEDIEQLVSEIQVENKNVTISAADMLAQNGYTIEKHEVTTEDGYKLTMFRIPSNGTPVLVIHGLLGSSDDFIVAGPGNGLVYLLADKGYDVWLGNVRGTKHSRRHATFKTSEAKFWNFSWHEIGIYDLPAMVDYTLSKSNKTSLKYVGHSQGTTVFLVMLSEKPEYNEKVELGVILSPIAFMAHTKSPVVKLLAPDATKIYELYTRIGIYEYWPDNRLVRNLKTHMCNWDPLLLTFCYSVLFLLTGFNFEQINVDSLPAVIGHAPSGCAVKQIVHYAQEVMSKSFRKFDYGVLENRIKYGADVPPSYNLTKVTIPVSIMFAEEDWLAQPKDVKRLRRKLKNVVEVYKVPNEKFNHLDFLFAKDVKYLVNNVIISMLSKY